MTLQNTEILRRISVAGLHPDDAREITRIFPALTEERRIQILEKWDSIIGTIKLHREEMEREKEILLVQALEDIEHDLEEYSHRQVRKTTKKEMQIFQENI